MKKLFKNSILASLLMLSITSSIIAQSRNDIFAENTTITYLGADFSNARFLGDGKTSTEAEALKSVTQKINNLIITEYEKYDIGKALKNDNIKSKIDVTSNLNEKIDANKIIVSSDNEKDGLTTEVISKIVSKYNLAGYDKGIGMVFIVDLMSKLDVNASIWVTFIDLNSKAVLLTEKMTGDAGGFGLRNYWARPFAEIISQIKSKQLKKWKANEPAGEEKKSKKSK